MVSLDNFALYALDRAVAGQGTGKVESNLQVRSLINEFKRIIVKVSLKLNTCKKIG